MQYVRRIVYSCHSFRKVSDWQYFFFSIVMIPSTLLMPVKPYLERKTADKTLTAMDWPPQIPELNIIGAVCDHLDRERNKGQPKSKEE